jgi:signal transduction histidine kinase
VVSSEIAIPRQSSDLSNSDQHQNLYWTIVHRMARCVSSGGHRRNGAVAPAAGLRRDRRNGGTGPEHVVEEQGQAEAATPDEDTLRYVASLASAAAHEINNPLAVIMGYAQLLADQVDAHGREQMDEILQALSRIQEIVRQMRGVTRIELAEGAPDLPEMLDLRRSSEPALPPH